MLSETFITSKTEKLINMKGYSIHTMNRVNTKGGGTALLINKEIKHKQRKDLEIMTEKEAESTFIEMIAKNGKKFVIGSLYRAPNTREDIFINYIKETIHKIKSEKGQKEIIIGMDQNLNLLKANQHKGTSQFLDIVMDLDMIPTITRPTRITNTTATLIDNIYISGKIQWNYETHLILSDISDHLPSLLLLKQTKVKDKTPIEFESRNLNDDKIMQINNELRSIDWNGQLNSNNCNTNFNTFCSKIKTVMDKVAPIKTIQISGRRRFMELWLTTGLECSSRTLKKLYTASLREGATKNEKKSYREYRNIYNRTKRAMMKKYYSDKSSEYRTNTKKLWELMNSIIGENKNKGSSIWHLTVEGVKIFNRKMIAEEFAKFYSNLGESLASKITPGSKPAENYLSLIPRIVNSLVLGETNASEIEKIIDHLPNKASSGHDGVSNILLKKLGKSLSYSLGIIFNQSIASGCFPDMMKVAEIIPLYKGKEED